MKNTPKVTVSHVWELLDATQENPVLYVTEDGELEVWAGAYATSRIVARQHEVKDDLLPTGADPLTDDDIEGYLPGLQRAVDEVCGDA